MRLMRSKGSTNQFAALAWWLFSVLVCAQFTCRYVFMLTPFLDLPAYAAGNERMPFQGRVLMAWLLHATAQNHQLSGLLWRIASLLPVAIRNPYSVVLLAVVFLAMLEAVYAGRLMLEHFTGDAGFSAWAALLTVYMAYFNLMGGYASWSLPYDVPALAVFMTAMWLIVTRRYWPLLLVVIMGSFNRETAVFVPVLLSAYAWFDGRPRAGWWWHVALQVLGWLAIRLWIYHHFQHSYTEGTAVGGGLFAYQLHKNLLSLIKPTQWPLFVALFGFTLPFVWVGRRYIGNAALAHTAMVSLALWTGAMLIVGVIVEIRIFNEMTAVVMPCVALIVWNRWVKYASVDFHGHTVATRL